MLQELSNGTLTSFTNRVANPLISIIVPVYNTPAELLERCVDSIINQTYANLEVILADDGSDSACSELVDLQAALDSRIRALHLPHGGVSVARNAALEQVGGEWVSFADADDEVLPRFVEEALQVAKSYDADFISGNYISIYKGSETGAVRNQSIYHVQILESDGEIDEYRKQFLSSLSSCVPGVPPCVNTTPNAKLYKTDLLNGIYFEPGLAHYEDSIFCFRYLERCTRIAYVSDASWYAYYRYSNSSSRRTLPTQCLKDQRIINSLYVGRAFENALAAKECVLALRVADELFAAHEERSTIITTLREMSAVGDCFSRVNLDEFRLKPWTRAIYSLLNSKKYVLASALIDCKIRIKSLSKGDGELVYM